MILRKPSMIKSYPTKTQNVCAILDAYHRYPSNPNLKQMIHNPYGSESIAEFRNNTSIKVQSTDYKTKIPESEKKVLTP